MTLALVADAAALRFRRELATLLREPRFIWMPQPHDHLVGEDFSDFDATVNSATSQISRLQGQGNGHIATFDGTNDFLTTLNSNRQFSFNSAGVTDLPFSVIFFGSVTDTALNRHILAKYDVTATLREWRMYVLTTDVLLLALFDESADVEPDRHSDAAITQGSLVMLGATYSGLGGASAADGIVLYQNGAIIASTAANNASYVAMEDVAANVGLGARLNTLSGTGAMQGSMGLVALTGVALRATEMADIYALLRRYFKV